MNNIKENLKDDEKDRKIVSFVKWIDFKMKKPN